MRNVWGRLGRAFVALVVGSVVLAVPLEPAAAATTRTWVGPSLGSWSSGANWSPSGAPQNGDSVVLSEDSVSVFDLPGLEVASVSGPATAGLAIVNAQAGEAPLVVTGPISTQGSLTLNAPVALAAGTHDLTSARVDGAGFLYLGDVRGAGGLRALGPSLVQVQPAPTYAGTVEVQGRLIAGGLGASSGGTTLAPGGALEVNGVLGPIAEAITVAAGDPPATFTSAEIRYTGAFSLQNDLVLNGTGTLAGPVSGPGGITASNANAAIEGDNTYSGGTRLQPGALRVAGIQPLGTGPVQIVGGRLAVDDGTTIANSIDHQGTLNETASFLHAAGDVTFAGPVSSASESTTSYVSVADGGSAAFTGAVTSSTNLYFISPGPSIYDHDGFAAVALAGPASLTGGLSTTGVDVDLGPGASIGADLFAGASVTFSADGQLAAASRISTDQGWVDLLGTNQSATSLAMGHASGLLLGVLDDGGPDFSRLDLSGGFAFDYANSWANFLLASSGNDQIRASSVVLNFSDFYFFHDGSPAPNQVFRIIDNTGTAPVSGIFKNSPEGSVFQAGSFRFRLSYVGGTGNDVTLTRLPGIVSSWGYDQEPTSHGGFMRGAPALSSWGVGRLDGWVVGADRQVWHRWQSGSAGAWEPLGGIALSTPAAVSQQPGQADVFIRGNDNGLWVRSFRNGWGPWLPLGGVITEAPSVTSPSPGNIVVVARGGDGAVWMRRMVNGSWQPWSSLGGRTDNAPAVTDWGGGRFDVWIRGVDGALWQRTVINGSPLGWQHHGGVLTDGPAAASSAPGDLLMLVRGGDGLVYERSWEGSAWTAWRRFDVPVDVRPAVTGAEPGHLYMGIRDFDGSLTTWHVAQDWATLASVGAASIGTAADAGGGGTLEAPGRR